MISRDDFRTVDMRVGRILAVEDLPEARRPSYKLTVDLGPLGTRRSARGAPLLLRARQVVCVVNFPPLRVAGVASEVLVLGALEADGRVVLLSPDEEATLGAAIG